MSIPELTDDTFVHETAAGLVLVDFWAEWCGPCRMLSLILDQLAGELRTVHFRKINADRNPTVASSLGISALPALVLYKDGRPVDRMVGLLPKERLKQWLARHL